MTRIALGELDPRNQGELLVRAAELGLSASDRRELTAIIDQLIFLLTQVDPDTGEIEDVDVYGFYTDGLSTRAVKST